jgi:hypothetical protein
MRPSQVRQVIGRPYKSFKRTPQSAHPCDFFQDEGIFVYYEADGKAEAVEFAQPAEPIFEGTNLLSIPFSELAALIQLRDRATEVETTELTSKAIGIGAYAPEAEESPEKPAESVIVFKKGYYD